MIPFLFIFSSAIDTSQLKIGPELQFQMSLLKAHQQHQIYTPSSHQASEINVYKKDCKK